MQTDTGVRVCHLRGKLKRGPRVGDVAAVGDWVLLTAQADGEGMIEAIEPRKRMFSRLDPTPRGVYQQILVANPDQMVMTFACAQPAPPLGMLDRFLVIAEKQRIPALIVANKLDLVDQEQAEAIFGHYPALGYPVIYTSAEQALGVDMLRERLASKISVFVGPSGVGKSSLLNAIQPGRGLAVKAEPKDPDGATRDGRAPDVSFTGRRLRDRYTRLESIGLMGYPARRSGWLFP